MIIPILNFLRYGNQLKRTPRTGWLMRGVPDAETVAEHTFGVAFIALVLHPYIDEPLDLGRLLALAVLHDLPEALTTDIPAPVWRRMPGEHKPALEEAVLNNMVDGMPERAAIDALWAELQANETVEARLVHEIDKLEMYLQADQYEKQYGNSQLAEFWETPRRFAFPIVQQLYDAVRAGRD